MTELDSYIENNDVDIIVLAVPKNVAQNIVSNLKASKRIEYGILQVLTCMRKKIL